MTVSEFAKKYNVREDMEKEAIFEKELRSDKYYTCSYCHTKVEYPGFKCPHCGSDIIGEIIHESLGGICDK